MAQCYQSYFDLSTVLKGNSAVYFKPKLSLLYCVTKQKGRIDVLTTCTTQSGPASLIITNLDEVLCIFFHTPESEVKVPSLLIFQNQILLHAESST